MKIRILLLALALATPLFAADASKILLSGNMVNLQDARATGSARAMVGDLNITADAITFDRQKNVLKCDGPVAVRTPSGVVTGKNCTIELPAGAKRVFVLQRDGEVRLTPAFHPLPSSLLPEEK